MRRFPVLPFALCILTFAFASASLQHSSLSRVYTVGSLNKTTMTELDTIPTSTPTRFRLPLWLAIPLVTLIVACSALLVYKYLWKRDHTQTGDLVALPQGGGGFVPGTPRFARPVTNVPPNPAAAWGIGEYPEGVSTYPRGTIIARRGPTYLRYNPATKTLTVDYLASARRQWLNRQQWELHDIAYRVTETRALAEHMKVTDAQKQQLRALAYNLPLTAAEQSTLLTQIETWQKSVGVARESSASALLMSLQQIGTAHLEQTKAAMLRRAQQISTILTPDQLKLAQTYFTPTPAKP